MWFTFPAGWHILVQVSGYLSSFPVLFLTLIPFIPLPIFPMSYCFALVLELFAFSLSISPHRSLPFFFFFAFLKLVIWHCTHTITPSSRTDALLDYFPAGAMASLSGGKRNEKRDEACDCADFIGSKKRRQRELVLRHFT